MSAQLDLLKQYSALSGGNAAFLESLYEGYLNSPDTLDDGWKTVFDELTEGQDQRDIAHGPIRAAFTRLAHQTRQTDTAPEKGDDEYGLEARQAAVLRLINAYRVRGHQLARLDPLGLREPKPVPDLSPAFHNLNDTDLHTRFDTGSLFTSDRLTLNEIIGFLEEVYCGTIGSEYMHITDTEQKRWLQRRLEGARARPNLKNSEKRALLQQLSAAEGLERFLHTQYVGQKRFSLEGGESLIPLLDELIQRSGAAGIVEIVLGMAHRGRLNVLTNILGKPPSLLFDEFEGRHRPKQPNSSGDVKYHQGFSSNIQTANGVVHIALSFNPSHLEIIDPVVQGSVRARQGRYGDYVGKQVLPVLIHGDAAFAGQGVVMETLSMSQARGFSTGGTVHIVINNQIGFTTSNPMDARSSLYCTDVAKMIQAPIIHVNGDDPEAVLFVTRLAIDFRMAFSKDIVIDLVCYRRQGHNEADEPSVTQPRMYRAIRNLATTRSLYADKLVQQNVIEPREPDRISDHYRDVLAEGGSVSRPMATDVQDQLTVDWSHFEGHNWKIEYHSGIPAEQLRTLTSRLSQLPPGFALHPRVQRIIEDRTRMAEQEIEFDWGAAEILAYGTLLQDGYPIRLSGQDSGRGTFFHRHAILHDQHSGQPFVPLQNIHPEQPRFGIIDSLLSEEAVLGFEYGYATAEPDTLTIWEAQFGDFANGAQVVIDQFIVAGEAKWGRLCGLTMLLPHGYEGQGPEHSSARLERYLQLCAEHNIQVCTPTTPSQIFHLLRRQMVRRYRKPLIIMSPKSLLRHKLARSPMSEFADGRFHPIIDEIDAPNPKQVRQIILCCGKVYYDLLTARREREQHDIAILRLEQLYPFPVDALLDTVGHYPNVQEFVWCQEEPQNQGAWDQIKHRFRDLLNPGLKLRYAGRANSASPAAGYYQLHLNQQQALIDDALRSTAES